MNPKIIKKTCPNILENIARNVKFQQGGKL
jgi:hypothetical protein